MDFRFCQLPFLLIFRFFQTQFKIIIYLRRCPFSADAAPHFNAMGRIYTDLAIYAVDSSKYKHKWSNFFLYFKNVLSRKLNALRYNILSRKHLQLSIKEDAKVCQMPILFFVCFLVLFKFDYFTYFRCTSQNISQHNNRKSAFLKYGQYQ